MKNKRILIPLITIAIVGGSILTSVIVTNRHKDSFFESMVESLTDNEGGKCTGPKKSNFWGQVFCHCENDSVCSDEYGCNS